MILHFAYGSNMSRAVMRARCRDAHPLGVAVLQGWRFLVNADGYASVAPRSGATVPGVLWRLTPRDLAALNAYEALASGLYRRRVLPVLAGQGCRPALVYVARRTAPGRPRPGYLGGVVEAAQAWQLPPAHVAALRRWSASGWRGAGARETGETG